MKTHVFAIKSRPARAFTRRLRQFRAGNAGATLHHQRAEIRHILHGPRLQAKLTLGAPDDEYEREADRVADAVMRMPEPTAEAPAVSSSDEGERIQRSCKECEEEPQRQPIEELEEGKELGHRTRTPGNLLQLGPDTEARIQCSPADDGAPAPAEEEVKRARDIEFSEDPSDRYAGFDPTTRPPTLVVPEGGSRLVAARIWPSGSEPQYVNSNPGAVSFELSGSDLKVTGHSKGFATYYIVKRKDRPRLGVVVAPEKSVTVDYFFLRQSPSPDRPERGTARNPAEAATLHARLEDIIGKQVNIHFRTGASGVRTVPDDLSAKTRAWFESWIRDLGEEPTRGPFWLTILPDLKATADVTLFFLWGLTAAADEILGGVAYKNLAFALISDTGCPDDLAVPHEVTHLLTPEGYPSHDGHGLMLPSCPAEDSSRILAERTRAIHEV